MNTWSFDNDELFELVRCGRKTATCAVLDNEPLSSPGDVEQIVNSKGEIIKIKIINVEIKRFCDIDATWAKKEGEGDLSLAYWQKVHKDFFTKYYENFTPEIKLVCEEFVLI